MINKEQAGTSECLSIEKSKMEEWRRIIPKDQSLHVFNSLGIGEGLGTVKTGKQSSDNVRV